MSASKRSGDPSSAEPDYGAQSSEKDQEIDKPGKVHG
jgi:hypothetical protein